jgi:NAD-dependent dihydropyrimidine dehydrogenase PreA subunit
MSVKEMMAQEWQTVSELRYLRISLDPDRCKGTWQCYEVCPIGLWTPNYETRIVEFGDAERCIACGACVLQCQPKAITLEVRKG